MHTLPLHVDALEKIGHSIVTQHLLVEYVLHDSMSFPLD